MPKKLVEDSRIDKIRELFLELSKEYKLKEHELYQIILDIKVPIRAFSSGLSSFEIIVKFLKENLGLSFSSISRITGRTRQTIWVTYKRGKEKSSDRLSEELSKYDIPISLLKESKYSVLEGIIVYLRETHELRYSKIAELMHRDQRNIWSVYQKARKKEVNSEKRGKE